MKLRASNQAVVLRGAAARSSMPNSSGSDFINQYGMVERIQGSTNENAGSACVFICCFCVFVYLESPAGAARSDSCPFRFKVVAFRSHQVHPTRDAHHSDTWVSNPIQAVGSRIFRVLAYTAGDNSSGTARPI